MGLPRRVGLRSRRRACACTVAVGPATTTLIRLGILPKFAGPTATVLPSGADVSAAPPGAELDPPSTRKSAAFFRLLRERRCITQ